MIEIIKTEDGSHSLYIPELKETYHSTHGALRESEYVFIQKGLNEVNVKKSITLLEVGFGTALNAFLTYIECQRSGIQVDYHTLEPFPLEEKLFAELNYPDLIAPDKREIFFDMHKAPFDQHIKLSEQFSFTKYLQKLENFQLPQDTLDLVFFDAFAPSKQPELWEEENFRKIFNWLKKDGILVSYCASGQFKRNLKSAGFIVETLPGPPGKKEMTRARKALS